MMKIQILHTLRCGGALPTIERVKQAMVELDLTAELEIILIETPEQAAEHEFFGSPTVRINSLDIEPAARNNKASGFG